MRKVFREQYPLGATPIEEIEINPKSRDDIPALLLGLQTIWKDTDRRAELFELLDRHLVPGKRRDTGRPGMDLWRILVMAVLKQGLDCDFDRLHELVNEHRTVRLMLGHADDWVDGQRYEMQNIKDNFHHVSGELLREVNALVVSTGHKVARKKPGATLAGRCDSFVVETNVHFPTDLNLLLDAMRCLIRETARACKRSGVPGWRQSAHLFRRLRRLFARVSTSRKWRTRPDEVKAYLEYSASLLERSDASFADLEAADCPAPVLDGIARFAGHARRFIDQIDRRVLRDLEIPHAEKVFSIFEDHTRWVMKGKAGVPVELGVPVCVVEDRHGFVLGQRILWNGGDIDAAVPLVADCQARHPQLRSCSFDRGFHSPANRAALDRMLDVNALPRKGRLSRADREREAAPDFAAARRAHPGVESAINNLEKRGLGRVLLKGRSGFARAVGVSVLALNIHRIGLLLQRRRRRRLKIIV